MTNTPATNAFPASLQVYYSPRCNDVSLIDTQTPVLSNGWYDFRKHPALLSTQQDKPNDAAMREIARRWNAHGALLAALESVAAYFARMGPPLGESAMSHTERTTRAEVSAALRLARGQS